MIICIRVFRKHSRHTGPAVRAAPTPFATGKQKVKSSLARCIGRPTPHPHDIYPGCFPPPYQDPITPHELTSRPRGIQNDETEVLNTIGMLLDEAGHITDFEVRHQYHVVEEAQ
jgi:hypothetical protein